MNSKFYFHQINERTRLKVCLENCNRKAGQWELEDIPEEMRTDLTKKLSGAAKKTKDQID